MRLRRSPDFGFVAVLFFIFEHVPLLSFVSSHDLCGVARKEDKITSTVNVLRVCTFYVLATSRIATYQIAAVTSFLIPLRLNDAIIAIVDLRFLCVLVVALESGSVFLMLVLSIGLVLPS